jgi:hypothetical protein
VKFYFDRTQSPYLARAAGEILLHLDHAYDHSRQRYHDRDPGDIVWMQELANDGGLIVISGDQKITRNPGEKAIWRSSGLTAFFLHGAWQHVTPDEQAWRLIKWLRRIIAAAEVERAGTGLSLPLKFHNGRLQRIYSPPARHALDLTGQPSDVPASENDPVIPP